MQRIGVFVCHCGTNIAGTVDVKAVAEALKTEPGVVFSTDYQYMCSQAGQEIIKNAIAEYKLTGIVVCSCSPRMHETTFRKTAAAAGLIHTWWKLPISVSSAPGYIKKCP